MTAIRGGDSCCLGVEAGWGGEMRAGEGRFAPVCLSVQAPHLLHVLLLMKVAAQHALHDAVCLHPAEQPLHAHAERPAGEQVQQHFTGCAIRTI